MLYLLQSTVAEQRDWLPTIVSLVSLIAFIGGGFKAYGVIIEKINGLGTRVTATEALALKAITLAETTKDDLNESRREVMTMLFNSERAAAERDTVLKVELARLAERVDIESIVTSVVSKSHRS